MTVCMAAVAREVQLDTDVWFLARYNGDAQQHATSNDTNFQKDQIIIERSITQLGLV